MTSRFVFLTELTIVSISSGFDRSRVDDLDRNVKFVLNLFGRLQSKRNRHRTSDDRAVRAFAFYIGDTERDREIVILGNLAL